MDSDKQPIERVREIFTRAQQVPSGEARENTIAEACGDNAALRLEVESLLAAYDTTCDFLSHDATGTTFTDAPDLVGTMIDDYRLIEHIGEGGFGEVYRAEQLEPFRREVALKVIKLGMDSKNVVARFAAERQALARMSHAGIAQVYDAGTTKSGRPYFVMELVHGIPILEYCDRNRLPLPERIDLFRRVCDGVQHAHRKGILHRDLKPSNILVGEESGKPVPKIIDFGVAKSLEDRLTEQTLITLQEMLIGTPMYMSPEQLNRDTDDLDPRSDIFSLGVILYELLAGATPLEHKTPTSLTLAGMRQALNEKELPRPSKRFHALGKKTTVIADRRQIKPPTLERQLRGDLDWVVMKAIEKERQHRYDDVISFSEDLERYRNHEPVSAGAPSLVRRANTFMRRHRMEAVIFASVGISLLLAVGVITIEHIKVSQPPTGVFIKDWKLERFCSLGGVKANRFEVRSDGSVLVLGAWGTMDRGLYIFRKGDTDKEATPFSIDPIYANAVTAAVILPEGVYVANNTPTGTILKVPPEGGPPTVHCDERIYNPYALLVAPPGFDGPNVDPGDLLVFDNAYGNMEYSAIRAVSRSTGANRPLIVGNLRNEPFLSGSFGPDGILYAGLNDNKNGVDILRVSPQGKAKVVLKHFRISDIHHDRHRVWVAAHPVTGELFFCSRNETYAFIPGKTQPRRVAAKGEELRWAADGSKLYLADHQAIWTLTGPDIATRPVSIGQ